MNRPSALSKIAFIIPYFGKFNNYFPLWLKSCEFNDDIQWIIFTDDCTVYDYPKNVTVHYTTFEQTISYFQKRFDFALNLKTPYQLCEYKVAYGDIYSEFLTEYDFWGFCDVDLIWGDIRSFLTDKILTDYQKISWRGHFTLFKNSKEINELYKSYLDGVEIYKLVFSDSIGIPFAFDELWLNRIFENKGCSIYKGLPFADLKIRSKTFDLLHFPISEAFKNKNQIFIWHKGKLKRIFVKEETLFEEEFCYIHFLKRPMSLGYRFSFSDAFLITPNKFEDAPKAITTTMVLAYSRPRIYISYIISRLSFGYIASKISYFLGMRKFKSQYGTLPSMFYEVIISPNENTKEIGSKYYIE